jgi:hypothetical protein
MFSRSRIATRATLWRMREIRRLERWAYSAQAVNKQLAGSVLLTRKGYGHVS